MAKKNHPFKKTKVKPDSDSSGAPPPPPPHVSTPPSTTSAEPVPFEIVYRDYLAQGLEEAATAKAEMYRQLADYPLITLIEAEYDGSSDSGNVEGINGTGEDGSVIEIPETLYDAIADYVYTALPGGWEINEGSFGSVEIDVRTRVASFDHSNRIESVEHEPFTDEG